MFTQFFPQMHFTVIVTSFFFARLLIDGLPIRISKNGKYLLQATLPNNLCLSIQNARIVIYRRFFFLLFFSPLLLVTLDGIFHIKIFFKSAANSLNSCEFFFIIHSSFHLISFCKRWTVWILRNYTFEFLSAFFSIYLPWNAVSKM